MVDRARALAFGFVAVLVLSIVPGWVPTAAAGTLDTNEVQMKRADQSWGPVTGTLGLGKVVRFSFNGTTSCEAPLVVIGVSFTVKTQNYLTTVPDTSVTVPQTTDAAPSNGFNPNGKWQFTTADLPVAMAGFDGKKKLDVVVSTTCGAASTPQTFTMTEELDIDTKAPDLGVSAPVITYNSSAYNSAANTLEAGSRVSFTVTTASDARGVASLAVNDRAINTNTGGQSAPPVPLAVPTAGSPTVFARDIVSTLDGGRDVTAAAGVVTFRVEDVNGNFKEQPFTFAIDNNPPATKLAFAATGSEITRQLARTSMSLPASTTIKPVWAPPSDSTRGQIHLNGTSVADRVGAPLTPSSTLTLPAALVGDGLTPTPSITVRPVDAIGNEGPVTTATDPLVYPRIAFLNYGPNGGIPDTIRGNLGTVSFRLLGDGPKTPAAAPGPEDDVSIRLQHSPKGYLNDPPGTPPGYGGSDTTFHAAVSVVGGQTVYSVPFSGVSLDDGTYLMEIHVNGAAGTKLVQVIPFRSDKTAPTLRAPGATTNPVLETPVGLHMLDDNPVHVRLEAGDSEPTDFGLDSFWIDAVRKSDNTLGKLADGTAARRVFRLTDCGTPRLPVTCLDAAPSGGLDTHQVVFTDKKFEGRIRTSFPGLEVGDYVIRVGAMDVLGNVRTVDLTDNYRVSPSLKMVENPGTPFVSGNKLLFSGLAAFNASVDSPRPEGATCADPDGAGGPLGATLCRPPTVSFQVRNVEPGSVGAEKDLGQPFASVGIEPMQTFTHVAPNGTTLTFKAFNYTPTGGLDLPAEVTNQKTVQVRMLTTLNGVTYTSPWATAESELVPALALTHPPGGWKFNTTGRIRYELTFDLKVVGTPDMRYTLFRQPAGALQPVVHLEGSLPRTSFSGNVHFYNGTLPAGSEPLLPDGEYTLRLEPLFQGQVKTVLERNFAVQREQKPTVEFPDQPANANQRRRPGTDIFDVGSPFNLTFRVNHGLLNVTSLANFSFDLTRAVARDPAGPVIPNDTAGFRVDVLSHTPFDDPRRLQTNVTVRVTLPTSARDGDSFLLRLNATGDRWIPEDPVDASFYKAVGVATLKLDKSPPAVGVLTAQTNASGDSTPSNLSVFGFAEDIGSGIESVEVRVYDVTRNRTILWTPSATPTYAQGLSDIADAFASSRLVHTGGTGASARYAANVLGVVSGAERVSWSVGQWYRPVLDANGVAVGGHHRPLGDELDNESIYRVDVRARDRLGQVSEISSREVRFDTTPPVIVGAGEGSGIGVSTQTPGEVGWHGQPSDARFFVNASDNKCLKAVHLRGFDPKGQALPRVPMRPVTPFTCGDANRGVVMQWTVSAREAPVLADLIGTYRYYVEAEDASGRNATGSTSPSMTTTLNVVDTQPPVATFINLEPPVIGEDSTSLVRIGIFENAALDKVEVVFSRMAQNGDLTKLGSAYARPFGDVAGNGTGTYVVDVAADLNLSLKRGDYLVQVRANDTAKTCILCPYFSPRILTVSDQAPPGITEEGAAKAYVNASPTLKYRVVDRAIPASGITVRVGNSTANLTAIPVTTEPIAGAGGARVGHRVTVQPTGLVSGERLHVEVKAAANLTNTTTFVYTVDAAPPFPNHTVTGLVTLGERQWALPTSRVTLTAIDNLSGVASLTYTVNGGSPAAYAGPITPSGDGAWTLEYTALDNASNLARGRLTLNLDHRGPNVSVTDHGDRPAVLVTDAGAGIDEGNVTVHYAYGNATAFVSKKMEKLPGRANAFGAELPGNATTQGLRYWFEAKDRLGNVGTLYSASAPHVLAVNEPPPVTNEPPRVTLLTPIAGSSQRGSVEVTWTSVDPEGKPLRVSLSLKGPDKPLGEFLLTEAEDAKKFTLDLTGRPAGSYTVTVVVTDGERTSEAESRSFVLEAGQTVALVEPPPEKVALNEEASFAVTIRPAGKTVRTASYVVTRDGAPFTTGTLTAQGASYAASVSPTQPGAYKVAVVVAYTDGTSDQPVEVATFRVDAPPAAPGFPASLAILLAVGVLTVALAAYGAFGRWK